VSARMSWGREEKILIWVGVWVLTRLSIVSQVGFWDVNGVELEDVNVFEMWSNAIATTHHLPIEESWQYPPGAAFLMLLPRIGGGDFGISFVVTMLVVDLIGLGLLARLAKRGGRDWGVWVWLLAMPLLFTLPVLRFDVVPTVIAIAALVVLQLRPLWFGALAGLGATIKVWPIFVLFAEWDRGRLLRSIGAAVATITLVFLVAQIAFGDQIGFLTNQGNRGLQVEAIAATPWRLREAVTGTPTPIVQRFGTNEIGSDLGDAVGKALDIAAFLALFGAAVWWWARDRAIQRGRSDLEDPDLARDFVFTVVLLFVVTSRVLSPQFMIWLVGLSAVVLCSARTRLVRPAVMVLTAVALSAGIYGGPAFNLVFRNLILLAALCDAAWTLVSTVRGAATKGQSIGSANDEKSAVPARLTTGVSERLD
jgi:hypothetical protein